VKYFFSFWFFLCFLWGFLPVSPLSAEEGPGPVNLKRSIEEERLDTIRYGTETEIIALIRTLREEKAYYLNDELALLLENTRNRNILSGVFSFFGEQNREGLEERAIRVIRERDDEANETVIAAVNYLGTVKAPAAAAPLETLLNEGEARFMGAAFRALGRVGGGLSKTDQEAGDEVAEYLVNYYINRNVPDENRRDIISALGETGSSRGVPFLVELVSNDEERAVLRMSALEALAKIGDTRGLDAILAAVSSEDPNIRSTAVNSLGPFSGKQVDDIILESFRDSYYRTRIGAAQAARERKLAEAVPYLRYRAERDEVPAVKDEAVRALGAIANQEAVAILNSLFGEKKNGDRVRILAAEMLTQYDADTYAPAVITVLDEAKGNNQTALYNGLLRVIGETRAAALEDLARRFFASGGVIEKSYALDITARNQFHSLAGEVRALTDSKTGSLALKALDTLNKLGLDQ
jgi:HEAT repeat protein